MSKMPDWATKFNKGPRVAQAVKEAGLEETTQFYALVGHTPAANSYELDFARALIEGEGIGQHEVTDVLTVSLSANDIEGHMFGPDSDAEQKMVAGLDRDLDSFFSYLDKKVGLANVMIALTADHGIAPIPAEAAKLGVASALLNLETFTAELDTALNARFSPGKDIHYFMPTQELPYIAAGCQRLRQRLRKGRGAGGGWTRFLLRSASWARRRCHRTTCLPPRRRASTRRAASTPILRSISPARVSILPRGRFPQTEFGRRIAHSYTDHGGWYVMVIPTAYQMELLNGNQTTHFSPWSYDRHVPLGFFGAEFVPGTYRGLVAPVDIAATFASILGVNAPSASVGRILTEALRPATEGTGTH